MAACEIADTMERIAALEAERDAALASRDSVLRASNVREDVWNAKRRAEERAATLEAALRDLEIAASEVVRCADVLVPGLLAGAGGTAAERVAQVARALRNDVSGGPTVVLLRARAALVEPVGGGSVPVCSLCGEAAWPPPQFQDTSGDVVCSGCAAGPDSDPAAEPVGGGS